MQNERFAKRFQELQKNSESIPFDAVRDELHKHRVNHYARNGIWQGWATSAQNLIKAVFGEDSPHYSNFKEAVHGHLQSRQVSEDTIQIFQEIFKSAKEDFESGCVFNVDLRVSGEVFGDFIVLAKQSLAEGHKDVAAVLAAAALEDSLKRYARVNKLNIDDKSMKEVANALKSKGLVGGAQKSLLDAMPRIRNYAMHAEWDKISEPDVNSIIGFVEEFLSKKFSS